MDGQEPAIHDRQVLANWASPAGLQDTQHIRANQRGEGGQAAQRFRDAGVSDNLIESLLPWGIAYTDRAERLQYH